MTILPFRFVLGFSVVILCCIVIRILTIGIEISEDVPLSGIRAKLIRFTYKIVAAHTCFMGGIIPI